VLSRFLCYSLSEIFSSSESSASASADEIVAPIPDAWKDRVLCLLATDLSLVSQDAIDAALRAMLGEMVVDFRIAMKRSVVDYILRSPVERRRVNILHPPRPGMCQRAKS
jgi:hypothetical protein